MSNLLNRLRKLLKEANLSLTEQSSASHPPTPKVQSAMNLTMQAAIEGHPAPEHTKAGGATKPKVKVIQRKADGGFGGRTS